MTDPRTALVTGACGGIGRATVGALRAGGWRVIGVDRAAPGDLAIDRFLAADLQVNQPLVGTSDEEWDAVMNTNVRAAFQLIRALHPQLAAARGAIVNVSSVHAIATSPNVAAYAVSKGALVALTRTAALELAADGIRCNAVLPGAVLTPMLRDGLARRPHPDGPAGNLEALVNRTPLGFVATPEQIAPTILHLADSSASPYTTGQTLVVDGGATIRLGTE